MAESSQEGSPPPQRSQAGRVDPAEDPDRTRRIQAHLGMVRSIASSIHRRSRDCGAELAELVQFGIVGLIEAVDRYDETRGAAFGAYATKRIRGAILDGLERSSEIQAQLGFRRRVLRERATSVAGPSPDGAPSAVFLQMIDVALGLAVGHLLEGTAMFVDESSATLHRPGGEGLLDSLAQTLERAVASLPEAERRVVELHYVSGLAFTTVAEVLGLSKGRISQLHAQALNRLRERCRDRRPIDLRT